MLWINNTIAKYARDGAVPDAELGALWRGGSARSLSHLNLFMRMTFSTFRATLCDANSNEWSAKCSCDC